MNHTPGPWKTCGFENLTVNDSEGNTIIACPGSSTGTLVEMKATAQFIVRACNAHEELVAALKGVLHHNDALTNHDKLPNSLVRQIENALAKAEGKETL